MTGVGTGTAGTGGEKPENRVTTPGMTIALTRGWRSPVINKRLLIENLADRLRDGSFLMLLAAALVVFASR